MVLRELRDNPDVRQQFSEPVEQHLAEINCEQRTMRVDELEKTQTEAIQRAVEQTILKRLDDGRERVTPEYRQLLETLGGYSAPKRLRQFNKKFHNLPVKLINEYWDKRAKSLNFR